MVTAAVLLQRKMITGSQWLEFFLFYETIRSMFGKIVYDWMQVKDIQGSVPKGTMTAIVGLCGSGKTTSLSLLERFYVPEEGQIRMGGTPVGEMPLGEYRKRFAYVQQNPEVFSGTIREALTYGIPREISDEEILKAARDAGFAEYLELQPEGLDAAVAPDGSSMSGGQRQRQRLVLAREFLRGAEVLLLDEATSNLDVTCECRVSRTFEKLMEGRTTLMIAHSCAATRVADHIIVMKDGRVEAEGTPEGVRHRPDGAGRLDGPAGPADL